MNLVNDHSSSLIGMHAAIAAVIAVAVLCVGALFGYATADLYELANNWVLRA